MNKNLKLSETINMRQIKNNAGSTLHKLITEGDWTGESAYNYLLTIKKKKDIHNLLEYRDNISNTLLNFSTSRIQYGVDLYFYQISRLLLDKGIVFDNPNIHGVTPLFNCVRDTKRMNESKLKLQLAMQLIDKGANFPHCINYAFKNNYLDIIEYYFNSLNINNIEQNEIHFKEAKDVPEHLYQRFTSVREKLLLDKNIDNNERHIKILKI